MWHMAEILAEPFSYARVDFYNNGGHIYFGEITFAPGGGSSKFNDKDTELWFGSLWQQDPRYYLTFTHLLYSEKHEGWRETCGMYYRQVAENQHIECLT